MRARYYSPAMRRFINADIIAGEISEAITLNRYAYANGNPVSNVDPFGLKSKNSKNEKVKMGSEDNWFESIIKYPIKWFAKEIYMKIMEW